MDIDPHRLPRGAAPRRYEILLEPDLAAATFAGRVRIQVDVVDETAELVLNAAELEIAEVTVDGVAAPFELDPALERLSVARPDGPFAVGPVSVEIAFTGTLNDRLHGFYRSLIRDADDIEHVVAASQMQATDCRRAFPCWDEPDFKAVFAVTLVADPSHLAITNAPEVGRTRRADGRDEVRFGDTMEMSSYLVALIVGPLAATPWVDVEGTPIRIVHNPGKEHLTDFALDAAVAALRYLKRYYAIPYPGEKIDFVALSDFASGAMENLGCITFRENLLLLDPATSTQPEQQAVIDVISHEIAHMWFGDLVTMRWWNGLWLNEAFATFMEVEATAHIRPDWHRWTTFALERGIALEVDALSATRPVEFEVRSPADAEGMFDVLTYQKGGALLRMLQQYLGEEPFRDGVRHYLATHAYGNTETSDLWDALEAITGEPARRLMDSWIWQPGFPLITAGIENGSLVLQQQRFGYEPTDDPAEWMVPLHLRVSGAAGETETKVLLDGERLSVPLTEPGVPIVVNAGGHAFVRVTYAPELLHRLSGRTIAGLSTIERFNLVADTWASVVARRVPVTDFLQFVRAFSDEKELPVWQAICAALRDADRLLDDETRPRFAATVRALLGPAQALLGFEPTDGEDQLTRQLRGLLVHTLAVIGDDARVRAHCQALFDVPDQDTIDPELLAAATRVVAAAGDETTYELFLEEFKTASTPQRSLRFLFALADFEEESLVLRTCALAFSTLVRTQNAPYLLSRAIGNRRHGAAAWRYVREHWTQANARFPSISIIRMVQPVSTLNREEDCADVQAFFAEHDIPQARPVLAQVLERQRVNTALRAEQEGPLAAALR